MSKTMIESVLQSKDSYRYTKKLSLKKGELLIDEYEKSEYFYYVARGVAAVNIVQDYQEYISAFVLPGDICGLDAISTTLTKKHSISVISKEMLCWKIKAEYLIACCSEEKEILVQLLNQFGNILQRHYDIFDIIAQPLESRIWQALLYLGNCVGKKENQCITLPSFITQNVLARFCRTTQPHISKQLQLLADAGMVLKKTIPICYKYSD